MHAGDDLVEEGESAGGGLVGRQAGDAIAGAVVDGGVLEEALTNLADVHLHALAGDRAAVAPGSLPLELGAAEPVLVVPDQLHQLIDQAADPPQDAGFDRSNQASPANRPTLRCNPSSCRGLARRVIAEIRTLQPPETTPPRFSTTSATTARLQGDCLLPFQNSFAVPDRRFHSRRGLRVATIA
jgi:hypothetical protein